MRPLTSSMLPIRYTTAAWLFITASSGWVAVPRCCCTEEMPVPQCREVLGLHCWKLQSRKSVRRGKWGG